MNLSCCIPGHKPHTHDIMSRNNKINTILHEKSCFVKIYKNNETAITHLKGNQNPYTHLNLKSCSINKKLFPSFQIFTSVWFTIPFFWDANVPLGHQ